MSIGNAEAIADWFKGKFVSKDFVYENLFTKYTITFIGLPNEIVTIVDKYRTQTVEIGSTGTETVDMYFIPGMTVDISMNTFEVSYTFGSQTVITIDILDGILPLYWYGNTCDHITGGFESIGAKRWSGATSYAPSVTYNADHMYLVQDISQTWTNRSGMIKPVNNIDISDYTKVCYKLDTDCYTYGTASGMNAGLYLSIDHEIASTVPAITIALAADNNPRQKTLNNYEGSYTFTQAMLAMDDVYIGFLLDVNTGYCKTKLKAVWLE